MELCSLRLLAEVALDRESVCDSMSECSNPSPKAPVKTEFVEGLKGRYRSPKSRAACHRCGNVRKDSIPCPSQTCPHVYCAHCHNKALSEFKEEQYLFQFGCPVCLKLCCCAAKTEFCSKLHHCYRKCPVSKIQSMNDMQLQKLMSKKSSKSVSNIMDIKSKKSKLLKYMCTPINKSQSFDQTYDNLNGELHADIYNLKQHSHSRSKSFDSDGGVSQHCNHIISNNNFLNSQQISTTNWNESKSSTSNFNQQKINICGYTGSINNVRDISPSTSPRSPAQLQQSTSPK